MNYLALLLAASLSAGNAEFEQASIDAAADIALSQLKAEIADKGLATNALERAMLADPVAYRTRSDAEHLCRELYRHELERNYIKKSEAILRELGIVGTATASDTNLLNQAAERHFARAFDTERKAACAAQAATIALKVKPDEADLEAKSDDEARKWLTDRIASAKGMNVFEENLKYISEKIVDPILADARKERKRQQEYLVSRARCDAWAPETLSRELEAKLRADVADRKKKCDDPERAWGVFPATLKSSLPVAVERRLIALVAKDIESVPFEPNADEVRKTIHADPAAHRKANDSEKIFRERFAKDLSARAIQKATERAPAAEREAFAAYVREHATGNEFTHAVDTRLKRDVLPKWKSIRQEIAKTEADRLWPTLADRTWYPEAELADKTLARSDYEDAVRDWRKQPELESLASKKEKTLEETDAAADKSIAVAFDLARKAVATQRESVGEVHPQILQSAKDLSTGLFSKKPNLAEVTAMLTEAVEKQWDEKRVATLWGDKPKPANADEQHKELFPSVKREIELIARQILEEIEKIEKREEVEVEKKVEVEVEVEKKVEGQGQEKKTEQEKKPEEPPPEETPPTPDEDKPEEELCTISFELSGGKVTVRAKQGSRLVAEQTSKATAKGFEEAVRQVGDAVGRKVFKLK